MLTRRSVVCRGTQASSAQRRVGDPSALLGEALRSCCVVTKAQRQSGLLGDVGSSIGRAVSSMRGDVEDSEHDGGSNVAVRAAETGSQIK